MSQAVSEKTMGRMSRKGMSPRQMEMNRRWAVYCAAQYETRRCDWDGSERLDPVEREALASRGSVPPGFYDAGGQMGEVPVKFRRPAAPYHLGKVIVNRFTGMLFSEKRHPKVRVPGDPDTEAWIEALCHASRLWQKMIIARNYGGATGTVPVGFSFVDGKPIIEPHDPRWCFPDFEDRATLKLKSMEKRYQYPVEERDQDTGLWETEWYWYRRVIDEESDIVYEPAPVGDGDEPDWVEASRVDHGFGFCPIRWVQNVPVDDDIDGEPDCHAVYDMLEAMDGLLSQAYKGTILNCDPTVIISSTDELSDLRKGSGNAVKLTNGTADYMEISGAGPLAARDMCKEMRSMTLEVAQCVLDSDGGPETAAKTATEVNRRYSSMISKADILREQYGQNCVLPLIEMMVEAARKLGAGKPMEGGGILKEVLQLPPKLDEDGNVADHVLGNGGMLDLQWPGYFEPGVDDAIKAVQAASTAKLGGLIDSEHAAKYVADFFDVENVQQVLESAANEGAEQEKAIQEELRARQAPMPGQQLPLPTRNSKLPPGKPQP